MCDNNKALKPKKLFNETEKHSNRRLKLWELDSSWHCSVLGTCLTMDDLRKVQRQCDIQFETPPLDYQLHATMVYEAKQNSRISHCLHKLLDKKYQRWINQWGRQAERNDLEKLWKKALQTGDIAGNFWALLTHPYTSASLVTKANGDVHMLSHIQGASNRADIRTLEQKKKQLNEMTDTLSALRRTSREKINDLDLQCREQERIITSQQAQISQLKATIDENNKEQEPLDKDKQTLSKRLNWAEHQLAQNAIYQEELQEQVKNLQKQVDLSQRENQTAEPPLKPNDLPTSNIQPLRSQNLQGKQVLYVGGRMTLLPHLREAVETHQGSFQHHDGGQEDNRASLHCHLEKADIIFCPIDCISHDACLRVKRYCKKAEKPFVPLRSSGVSTFTEELVKWA